jgi:hypothetical protein
MMIGIELAELQARHDAVRVAREQAQREAREKDLGFAYVLGELERLIGIVQEKERHAAEADAAALAELEAAAGIASEPDEDAGK